MKHRVYLLIEVQSKIPQSKSNQSCESGASDNIILINLRIITRLNGALLALTRGHKNDKILG